ncbi:Flp pilus assembly protein TadB [Hydrogenoanaerobacterium saccharovorans]|uniref:Flp pilus assembly protein TadB n=1 Tax=Hydrogenoanaerobacterium saccharovorans TaxID=474960 RepID=A0A1H8AYJ2_9FIRM|nr:hypothetical protein [Hydrogenoanaerobacterium saccharovorans]RPF47718.1 Flp pilus assembly protein TadB [Hydrogenoanaerobacterium saccharovorans]SEM74848.1 Flp pilus assembly protein TadB [Hydrogenoanaerobacterium saccharovorans]
MYLLCIPIGFGLLLYFWDSLQRICCMIRSHYKQYLQQAVHYILQKLSRKPSLKTRVKILNNGKKENFILRSYNTMTGILSATGEKEKIKNMRIISAVCSAFGMVLSFYLRSYMLIPILTVGFALLPMWLIKFKLFRYNLRMQNELSVVLSMVTNSYIRNENIVESIKENLVYMNEPCKSIFQSFVYASRSINPDPIKNLTSLKSKIDNHIFHLWCESLILCQNDINQKSALNAVVEQFATDKELYNMLSTEISKPMWTFIIVAILSSTCFPLIALMGHQLGMGDLLGIMFDTWLGQVLIVCYALNLLYGINKAIDLSTSME